ncbi:unnamed protein product [Rotaria socialis]|uniref:Paraquat-inducible protein A n=1 Tax=Rotaria socialis TaxID=392032 RepID=A0A818EF97_9BILA|nr:unnamed protein product [Rotaria socialis]CAF4474315.1 unnamed protein product [Rotaria socialis]
MDKLYKKFKSYQSFLSSKAGDEENNILSTSETSLPITQNKWTKRRIRNWASHGLTILSLIFLIPGLVCPMLIVHIYLNVPGTRILLETQKRGVITTVSYLFKRGGYFPGTLVVIFSILIPFTKAFLLLLMNFVHNRKYNYFVYTLIRDWGKWSMTDVFVTVIFLSFFASLLVADIDATILPGFYFFLTYCIISLAATQTMCPPPRPSEMLEEEIKKPVDRRPLISSNTLTDDKGVKEIEQTAISPPRKD